MLMVCHHLDKRIPEDIAFAESPHPQGDDCRRRHPARYGRVLDHRVGQPGHGPRRRGDHPHLADRRQDEAPARRLPEETGDNDNLRVKPLHRQIHHQPGHRPRSVEEIGSIEVGKRADLVLWNPAFFGVKPDMVLIGGRSPPRPWATPTPRSRRPSRCIPPHVRRLRQGDDQSSVTFVSAGRARCGLAGDKLGVEKGMVAVREHPRRHLQGQMVLNDARRMSRWTRKPMRSAPMANC
jgi:urease subunit alpha